VTIEAFKNKFSQELIDTFSVTEVAAMLAAFIEAETGFDKAKQIIHYKHVLSKESIFRLTNKLERLKKEEPFQYILGYTWFYNLKIKVNSAVLIPRPETEELVDWIVKENNDQDKFDVLDIGTGSGCIALGLKVGLKNSNITAVDVSEAALKIAIENAQLNDLQVHFEAFDVLNYLPNKQSALYDIIVSNPPYIPANESNEMEKTVIDYEPEIALFTPNENAFIFYEAILSFSRQYLKNNGQLYFEIHENKAIEMELLMKKYAFKNVECKQDAQNKTRMIKGIWQN